MTRLWAQGTPIAVATDAQGKPRRLRWQGRLYTVAHVIQEWEIDTDWWEMGGRIWCVCYAVLTQEGLLCVLCRPLPDGAWVLSKLYD